MTFGDSYMTGSSRAMTRKRLSGGVHIGRDPRLDVVGDGARGAVLSIVAGAHVGEDLLEAVIGRPRDGRALNQDFSHGIHQLERGVDLVDFAGGIAGDLHELTGQTLLDGDVEPIARGSRIAAAGGGEDQLVADLLTDPAGNGIDLDAGHHVGELLASHRAAAVKGLEAAAAKSAGYNAQRDGDG